jgi:hypothetical protein
LRATGIYPFNPQFILESVFSSSRVTQIEANQDFINSDSFFEEYSNSNTIYDEPKDETSVNKPLNGTNLSEKSHPNFTVFSSPQKL